MTYFFHWLPCTFRLLSPGTFPCFHRTGLKRNGSFHSGSPFQLNSLTCQEERQSSSYAILLQTLRLSGRGKEKDEESEKGEERQGGMKGVQEGLSSQVSGTVWPSEWLSFVRIWRVWVGGKQGASVSIHTLTSQTRPFCRHTPPHSSHNRARQQVNTQSAHLTSRAPASHQVPYRSITEVAVSIKEAVEQAEMEKRGLAGTAEKLWQI